MASQDETSDSADSDAGSDSSGSMCSISDDDGGGGGGLQDVLMPEELEALQHDMQQPVVVDGSGRPIAALGQLSKRQRYPVQSRQQEEALARRVQGSRGNRHAGRCA